MYIHVFEYWMHKYHQLICYAFFIPLSINCSLVCRNGMLTETAVDPTFSKMLPNLLILSFPKINTKFSNFEKLIFFFFNSKIWFCKFTLLQRILLLHGSSVQSHSILFCESSHLVRTSKSQEQIGIWQNDFRGILSGQTKNFPVNLVKIQEVDCRTCNLLFRLAPNDPFLLLSNAWRGEKHLSNRSCGKSISETPVSTSK